VHKIVFILLLFYSFTSASAQADLKADSTLSNYYYEVGGGFSNVGELILRGVDDQQLFPVHDQFSIAFSQHTKSDKYIRFGMVMGFYREVIAGGANNFINPFIITIGLEKKKTKKRWALSYGSDLYFLTTLKGTNIGGQIWQSENPGFGISGLIGLSYFISPRLSLRTETEIGFGVRQNFKNAGFVSQRVLSPSIVPIKTLSLELKYHF